MTPVDERLRRYAELAVRVGANVQPGQLVSVGAYLEQAPLARAVARAAYEAGARYVAVQYVDNHVRRAMIELAPEESLSWTPPWLLRQLREIGEERGASIRLDGNPEPALLSDLPPDRIGKARMVELTRESLRLLDKKLVNATVIACPTEGWARAVFGEPDVERLWQAVASCARLDEDDPAAAWDSHMTRLERRAADLNALGVDSVRFRGPGTDLTVGLMPRSRWGAARFQTAGGLTYVPNMPTEEVYTTPDRRRTEGTVRSTRPLPVFGSIVRELEIRFEGGRIVHVDAAEGAEVIRAQLDSDENAGYLGEVALVDDTSRVGQTGLTFFDVLYDENASCHIAYGGGVSYGVEGPPEGDGFNSSSIHTDFMIGGPEVDVDVTTRDGRRLPVLRNNSWVLERVAV